MGKAGPPKKPTNVKRLQGIPGGKSKLPKNEPKPKLAKDMKPPKGLKKEEKKIWKAIAPRLFPLGLLTELDIEALTQYCQLASVYNDAKAFVDKNGQTYKSVNKQGAEYWAIYPQVGLMEKLAKHLFRILTHFGGTPSGRSGIELAAPPASGASQKDGIKSFLYG